LLQKIKKILEVHATILDVICNSCFAEKFERTAIWCAFYVRNNGWWV